ncbi:hypothetical protein [Serratia plymuthica]|uniref:hypothetical protein n=1 Tax=Serratia plymuthica TaxID=82996 RepID=UPI0007EA1B25|nr:hypothetical protein [Serratia plymuthica]ANJ96165.1 hypothetical protein ADP72_25490 [Serratia plymuthica]
MSAPKNYHMMTLKDLVERIATRRSLKSVRTWVYAKEKDGSLTPAEVKKVKTAIQCVTIMKQIQKYNLAVNELESFDTVRFYAVDEMEYLLRTGYDTAQKSFRDEGM